jgi:hypothetical protein
VASPVILALIMTGLALPVQEDAVAAAPVLAVLVSKGMPAPVALAAWVVVAAPGARGLLAIAKEGGLRAIVVSSLATFGVGFASCVLVSRRPFGGGQLAPALERVGQFAAIVLLVPTLSAIWKQGVRGWLLPIFLHDHDHGHPHADAHGHRH